MPVFSRNVSLPRPVREVFSWYERPGVLERLTPPWEQVEIMEQQGGLRDGGRVVLRSKYGPFWNRWELEHHDYDEGRAFTSRMASGPFTTWEHRHVFRPDGPAACNLTDEVRYELPLKPAGMVLTGCVRARMERLFNYRHQTLVEDLAMARRYGSVRSMRFLIAGASGLVGRALVPFLRSQGHEVARLVRRKTMAPDEIHWEPQRGVLDLAHVKPFDVVVNLAGENIAAGRWHESRREKLRNSRIAGTRTIVTALERLRHRPFVMVQASASGYYGNRGDDELYEDAGRGAGFLAGLCEAWEKEAAVARGFGIRVAKLRTGLVLSPAGGALAKLLPVFASGLGGRIGSGRQWVSWIGIDDLLGAIYHAVLDQRCNGPVNAVSPHPVTNAEFAATLARVVRRPALFPVPAPLLRAFYGDMADETLLTSACVLPGRLQDTRYAFRHEDLETALRHVLGRAATR